MSRLSKLRLIKLHNFDDSREPLMVIDDHNIILCCFFVFFVHKGHSDVHHGPLGAGRIAVSQEQNVCAKPVYLSGARADGSKRSERKTDRLPTARKRFAVPVGDLAD